MHMWLLSTLFPMCVLRRTNEFKICPCLNSRQKCRVSKAQRVLFRLRIQQWYCSGESWYTVKNHSSTGGKSLEHLSWNERLAVGVVLICMCLLVCFLLFTFDLLLFDDYLFYLIGHIFPTNNYIFKRSRIMKSVLITNTTYGWK